MADKVVQPIRVHPGSSPTATASHTATICAAGCGSRTSRLRAASGRSFATNPPCARPESGRSVWTRRGRPFRSRTMPTTSCGIGRSPIPTRSPARGAARPGPAGRDGEVPAVRGIRGAQRGIFPSCAPQLGVKGANGRPGVSSQRTIRLSDLHRLGYECLRRDEAHG